MGGLYGLISVILGAYAAHSLRDVISSTSLSSWQTGVSYQMSHALVLLFTGLWLQLGGPRVLVFAGAFFSAGVLGFSGSILPFSANTNFLVGPGYAPWWAKSNCRMGIFICGRFAREGFCAGAGAVVFV